MVLLAVMACGSGQDEYLYSLQSRSVLSSLPSPNDVRCQLTTPSHGHQSHPMTQLTSASVIQGPFKPHVIMACVKRLLTVRLRGVGLPTPLLNRAHAYPCLPCPAQPHVAGAYMLTYRSMHKLRACTHAVCSWPVNTAPSALR